MSSRRRLALFVALGGVLALGLVLLYALVRDAGLEPAAGAPEPAQVVVSPTAGPRREAARPALPNAAGGDAAQQREHKAYTIGDVRVRDHRPGDPKPLDLPPNVHPPQARQLPSTLTADIGQQIRKVVRQCGREVPAAARGAKPQLEAQVTVAIDRHTLSISEFVSQVRDVEGPAADAMHDCVARNVAGLSVGAADQDDISGYGLRLAFLIPSGPSTE